MQQRGPPFPYDQWFPDPLPHIEMLENQLALQGVEIEQLDGDNQRLAASHTALNLEVADAHKEIESLKAYMTSIDTDSDTQMSALSEKMANMVPVISTRDIVTNELNQAKNKAQKLQNVRKELMARVQNACQTLEKAQTGVNTLEELLDEQNKLRREHQIISASYDHQRGVTIEELHNIELERKLNDMIQEINMLDEKLLNAKQRPYDYNFTGRVYMDPNPYPPFIHNGGPYVNGYGQPPLRIGNYAASPPVPVPVPETDAAVGSNGNAFVHNGGPYVNGYGQPPLRIGNYTASPPVPVPVPETDAAVGSNGNGTVVHGGPSA